MPPRAEILVHADFPPPVDALAGVGVALGALGQLSVTSVERAAAARAG